MKQIITYFLIAGLFAFSACKDDANTNKDSSKTEIKDTNSVVVENTEDVEADEDELVQRDENQFYIHVSGTIDDVNAAGDLFKTDDNLVFVYYTDNLSENVTLSGKINDKNEFGLESVESTESPKIRLNGTLNGRKFNGTLSVEGKESALKMKENYKESLKFKAYHSAEEYKSGDNKCSVSMFVYLPQKDFIADSICGKLFTDKKTCTGDIEQMMQKENESYINEFKESAEGGMIYTDWDRNSISDIVFNDNDILTYAVHFDDYSGGAHGNYSSDFMVFDLKNSKYLKTADIIKSGNDKFWSDLIYETIKRDNEMTDEDMESNYELPIMPNNNIYITNYGIGFFYNSYEIAPFVVGPSNVFFPFSQVKDKLNPEIISRFQ